MGRSLRVTPLIPVAVCLLSALGCRHAEQREMLVTAYCGCGECCGWERGSWRYLKLDFWNRYNNYEPVRGTPYTGRTASGTRPHTPRPGLIPIAASDGLISPFRYCTANCPALAASWDT